MPRKDQDVFERLCKFYEFTMGKIPWREEFKRTLRETVSAEELSVFFLLPFVRSISLDKLEKKARKAGISAQDLYTRLTRLADEGFIVAYETPEEQTYERGHPVFMTEQQVRKPEDTPRRTFYAQFFNTFLEGDSADAMPTKTPYFRVLPVEATLTGKTGTKKVIVDEAIPDPRGVLPLDVLSEIVKQDTTLIGVAECYCRKTKRILGQGCEHPLETCFVFNELADTLIRHGHARQIEYDEAMQILRQCEELGLVHSADNCEREILSVCNCCSSCCILIKTWMRGQTNAGAPSRYAPLHDADRCTLCESCISRCPVEARAIRDGRMIVDVERCLGCGLCVTACPASANRMTLRDKPPKMSRTNTALFDKISREAAIGIVKNKLLGR
jgi:Pyruvate/2-oxoacid:ferredoxin oxidoreductase delta subunit